MSDMARFRSWLLCLFSIALMCVGASVGVAQTTIVVSKPERKLKIALPSLCASTPPAASSANSVPLTVSKDLELSGYFDVLNPSSYIEGEDDCSGKRVKNYQDWRLIKADLLVKGRVSTSAEGVEVDFYLHDVATKRSVVGRKYRASRTEGEVIGHKIANEIVKYLTGEPGPFGSEIVFSSRVNRFKELFVTDLFGSRIRQLTREKGLAISPALNREGTTVLYTSYRKKVPDLALLDLRSGGTKMLTNTPYLEVGGDFAPDGQFVMTSVSNRKDTDLVVFDRRGRVVRRYGVGNHAIDVSPSYSPDGSKVAFCSNRSGGPQIYVLDLGSGREERVSFVDSSYCTSPAWSPKGDRLAFVCRQDGGFQINVSDLAGDQVEQLTFGGDNEDPSWSPDGRFIVFASTFGKRYGFDLALLRLGDSRSLGEIKRLTSRTNDDTDPTWGPVVY